MPGAEGNGRWRPTKTAKYGVGKQMNEVLVVYCRNGDILLVVYVQLYAV